MEEFSVSESQDLGSVYGPLMRIIESDTLAYRVIFAKTLKSPIAAIVLSQYLYWGRNLSSVKRDGWFYKTEDQFYDETGVSGKSQRTARKNLIENRILLLEKRGVPAKNWYKINYEGLATFLFKHAPPVTAWELQDTPDEDSKKSPTGTSGCAESVALSITESTTESTTEEESKNKNFSSLPSKTIKNFRNQRRAERGLPPIKSKLSAAQKRSLDELMLLQPDIDLYRSLAEEKGFIYLDQPESANTKIRRQMLAARSRFSEETPDFYQWIFNGNNKWAIKTQYSPESCIVSFMFDAYVNRNVEEKQNKSLVSMSNLYD